MLLLRKHIDVVRLVAVVATGTFLSACMTWQTQSLQPERFRTADSTQTIRLTLTSGDTIMVHAPVITGDSLVGMQTRPGASLDSLERVSIPLAAVSQAEVRKGDRAANTVLALVAVVAISAIAIAAAYPCGNVLGCAH